MKSTGLTTLILALMLCMAFVSPAFAAEQFKVWWYEPADNAMGISWKGALDEFQKNNPDVEVLFEKKSFEEIQTAARMVLNSDEAPDIMQTNKGNGTAGQYVKDGLLTNLEAVAKERGWDRVMSSSIQATCRYNENGYMGAGDLYAVTTYGEFVMVYYNKEMFDKYGLSVPTSLEEFEKVADTFVENGVIPFGLGGADLWPVTHNWFELVLYKADRDLVNKYQMVSPEVDLKSEAFAFGSQRLKEYMEKGYFDPNVTGIDYDSANLGFLQQTHPMLVTGSWMYKWAIDNVEFDWDIFLMPDKTLNTGSGGNVFVVPANAKNKERAYEFLDLVLGQEAQTVMANAGGIPLSADLDAISDPKVKRLNELFSSIVQNDGLAFYPDWPVPNFMQVLSGGLQELLAGSTDVDGLLENLSYEYDSYKE